jgi:dienelactone hydrolase
MYPGGTDSDGRRLFRSSGVSMMERPRWKQLETVFAVPLIWGLLICILAASLFGQSPSHQLPPAGKIGNATCQNDASESYSLYLPSAYNEQKRWPIIYLFDPSGRGTRPVELYQDVAEKYGFIIAGSNNSRNFSTDESRSVSAIWQDTHQRLALDVHRTYTGGFSGGARVAGLMATSCSRCQIDGVIANGAGYPSRGPQGGGKLLYFFGVGNQDFNWPEIVNLRREREEAGLPYRVRVFEGPHQWPPAEVMQDAVEWMQLKAMQAGDLPRDLAFIDRRWRATQTETEDAARKSDAMAELSGLRSLVTDFAGLKDTGEATNKLAQLKNSARLKAAFQAEQDQIAQQSTMEGAILPKIEAYITGKTDDSPGLKDSIQQSMHNLDDQAEHSKDEIKKLVSRRAADGVWIATVERGEQELASHHFQIAENCFQLMSQMRNGFWPFVMLADTHAAEGKSKQAVKDLREAMHRGLKETEVIESDDRLQVLKDDPDFQTFLRELGHQ